ncbi:MAG: glycosyltransferase family 2 protein [Lachnospiraceae bacterium]
MSKKFSLIVPVYNVEDYLDDTLSSIRNQTFDDFEVIMVDDGATDLSDRIAKKYAQLDNRFTYHRIEKSGIWESRNYGIKTATADYIVFVDGDDLLPNHALECYVKTIEETGADICIGQMEEFHISGSGIYQATKRLSEKRKISMEDRDLLWTFMISGKCYNRQWLINHNILFPALRYSEDGVFFMHCVYEGANLTGVPSVTYYYRKRSPLAGHSVTQKKEYELWKHFYTAHRMIESMAEKAICNNQTFGNCENLTNAGSEANRHVSTSYRQLFYDKFIRSIIKSFYRSLWLMSEETEEEVVKTLQDLLGLLDEEKKNAIINDNSDLKLYPEVGKKEDYLTHPELVVVLDRNISVKDAEITVKTLYSQNLPAFLLMVPETLVDIAEQYANAQTYSGDWQKTKMKIIAEVVSCPGYMIINSGICFPVMTLYKAVLQGKQKKCKQVDINLLPYEAEHVTENHFVGILRKIKKRLMYALTVVYSDRKVSVIFPYKGGKETCRECAFFLNK